MCFKIIVFAGFLFLAWGCAALEVDKQALSAAGEKTKTRLLKETAAWTAVVTGEQGVRVLIDIAQAPDKRRILVSLDNNGKLSPIASIIELDGKWYVSESGGILGIYRPYEAPFDLSILYQYLFDDRILMISPETVGELGTVEQQEGDRIVFRGPLPKAKTDYLQKQLNVMEKAIAQIPADRVPAKTLAQMENMKTALRDGIQVEVDSTFGIKTQYGAGNKWIQIEGFRFLKEPMPKLFDIAGKEWRDHSKALTTEELNDTIMINHWAQWNPQVKAEMPPDVRLLNLKTNELWRVPVQYMQAGPGCFLKDRTKVIVAAVMTDPPGLRLCEVDLVTGKNRVVCKGIPSGPNLLAPSLSPDGKTIAVFATGVGGNVLESQIYLIDLATEQARPLGEPCDQFYLNWLPDGTGVILERRTTIDMNKPSKGTICRMDLSGKRMDIRDGKRPLLLADGKSMMFEDENRAWHVCGLDGKVLRKLTDGSQWHMFESLSFAGDKILGTKNARKGLGAEAIVFDPQTGAETPLTPLKGLWTQPRAQ